MGASINILYTINDRKPHRVKFRRFFPVCSKTAFEMRKLAQISKPRHPKKRAGDAYPASSSSTMHLTFVSKNRNKFV